MTGVPPQSLRSISEVDAEIRIVEQSLNERLLIHQNLLQVQRLAREVLELARRNIGQPSRGGATATPSGTRTATTPSSDPSRRGNPTNSSGNRHGGRCMCNCHQSGGCEVGTCGTASSGNTGGTSSSGTTVGQIRIGIQMESDSSQSRSQDTSSTPYSQDYTTSGTSSSDRGQYTSTSSGTYTSGSTGTSGRQY